MIYEFRTYDLKPRSVEEFEKRFGDAYEKRRKHSELAAFWHTEVGPLNQVIHVWPYKDLTERNRIREEATKDGTWPAKTAEFIVGQRSDIYIPFPMSPEIKPAKLGPFYEMRIYTLTQGGLANIAKAWEHSLPARLKFGPLWGVMYSELGGINKFLHIWPYPSLDAR